MPVWTELTIEVPREHADAVASFLFDHGSTGLEEQENESEVRLRAYFDAPPPLAELEIYTRAIGAFIDRAEAVSVRTIDEEDWAETWRLHFEPLLIGRRLYVCPPWIDERPPDRIAIIIDPGMAFGTGQHATTRMCLEFAEKIVDERRVANAADLGAGSGILAIALAKLGVAHVHAVEIDPLAREATDINAETNGVGPMITTATTVDEAPGPFDFVVANLFTNLLLELAPAIAARVVPGGAFACSGFVEADAERVQAGLCAAGFRLRERRDEKPWVGLAFDRL